MMGDSLSHRLMGGPVIIKPDGQLAKAMPDGPTSSTSPNDTQAQRDRYIINHRGNQEFIAADRGCNDDCRATYVRNYSRHDGVARLQNYRRAINKEKSQSNHRLGYLEPKGRSRAAFIPKAIGSLIMDGTIIEQLYRVTPLEMMGTGIESTRIVIEIVGAVKAKAIGQMKGTGQMQQ